MWDLAGLNTVSSHLVDISLLITLVNMDKIMHGIIKWYKNVTEINSNYELSPRGSTFMKTWKEGRVHTWSLQFVCTDWFKRNCCCNWLDRKQWSAFALHHQKFSCVTPWLLLPAPCVQLCGLQSHHLCIFTWLTRW